jgi:membrane-associated phospholipid phosphatase
MIRIANSGYPVIKKVLFFIYFISYFFILEAQNLDIGLLRAINLNRNKNLDKTFKTLTNSATPVSITIPVIIFGKGLIDKDKEEITKGLTIGSTLILAALVSTSLKYSINRARPYVTYPDIEKATKAGSPSFPSGHTSDAFATATALSIAYPRWYVIAPSYLWATSIGYSRMHLGVHYPSDVVFGALSGSLSAYLCYRGQKWLEKRKK